MEGAERFVEVGFFWTLEGRLKTERRGREVNGGLDLKWEGGIRVHVGVDVD